MPSLLPIVAVTVELRAKLAPKLAPKLTLRNAPAVLDNELLMARPSVFATAWPTDEFTAWLVRAEIAVPADFAIALPADSDMLLIRSPIFPASPHPMHSFRFGLPCCFAMPCCSSPLRRILPTQRWLNLRVFRSLRLYPFARNLFPECGCCCLFRRCRLCP